LARISRSFRDLTRDRQTDDRCGDQNRRLSHQVCEPNKAVRVSNQHMPDYIKEYHEEALTVPS